MSSLLVETTTGEALISFGEKIPPETSTVTPATVSDLTTTIPFDSSECSVFEQVSGLSKPCQFPFVYKAQSYDKCIYLDNEGNDLPWCSTRTGEVTNEHIGGGGHYGDCSEDLCPVILDEVEFVKWTDQSTVGKYC